MCGCVFCLIISPCVCCFGAVCDEWSFNRDRIGYMLESCWIWIAGTGMTFTFCVVYWIVMPLTIGYWALGLALSLPFGLIEFVLLLLIPCVFAVVPLLSWLVNQWDSSVSRCECLVDTMCVCCSNVCCPAEGPCPRESCACPATVGFWLSPCDWFNCDSIDHFQEGIGESLQSFAQGLVGIGQAIAGPLAADW